MFLVWCLASIGAILGLLFVLHLCLRTKARRIRANPDPCNTETLTRQPPGERVVIDRPDGTQIHAFVAGDGPVVVLAHGYCIDRRAWNVVVDQLLKEGFRVITFDQRGHGDSTVGNDGIGSEQMASDYQALLEHFDVRGGVLVGHSMGAFLSVVFLLNYAEAASERLRGAVLFAGMAGQVRRGSLQNRIQIPLVKWGIISRIARSPTYGALFGASLYGECPSPSGIQYFLELFLAQNYRPLMPILRAMADEDHYARLPEIGTECVVISGELDKTTPRWHSERLATEIPRARAIWVAGRGHLLNWEAPEALIEAVQSLHQPPKPNDGQSASED